MDVLFTGFITVILVITVIQAIRIRKQYVNTIYPALFSNYLEYFYRYFFRQNVSTSNWIKQELGVHRLIYNSLIDKDGQVTQTYVTLLCTRGMFVIRDLRSTGKINGGKNDKHWIVSRNKEDKTKTYRIPNPEHELDRHIVYQHQQLKLEGHGILAFRDNTDLTLVKSNYPVLHDKDVVSYIKSQPEQLNEQQILAAFDLVKKN